MPDYAGAVAAIKDRLTTQWVDGSNNPLSLIVFVNETPSQPFPPVDGGGNPLAFLVCEVVGSRGAPYTFGSAGNRFFTYDGIVVLHSFTPTNLGAGPAQQAAVNAGEIFRAATFYVDANGSYVRTIAPNPPDGGSTSAIEGIQSGNAFRVTLTVPFQYFHRA